MKKAILFLLPLLLPYSSDVSTIDKNDAIKLIEQLSELDNYSEKVTYDSTNFNHFNFYQNVIFYEVYRSKDECLSFEYYANQQSFEYKKTIGDYTFKYIPKSIYLNEDGSTYESFSVSKSNGKIADNIKISINCEYEYMEYDKNNNTYHLYNIFDTPLNSSTIYYKELFLNKDENNNFNIDFTYFYIYGGVIYNKHTNIYIYDINKTIVPISEEVLNNLYEAIENNEYVDRTKPGGIIE